MKQLKEALIGKKNATSFKVNTIYCFATSNSYIRNCLRNDKRYKTLTWSCWEVFLCEEDMATTWIESSRESNFDFKWWIGIVKNVSNFEEVEKIIKSSRGDHLGKVIEKIAGNIDIKE